MEAMKTWLTMNTFLAKESLMLPHVMNLELMVDINLSKLAWKGKQKLTSNSP
jgi:hypothetical protein